MRTNIVTIGNSQCIRIPKSMLEQSKLNGEVELEVKGESIVIFPANKPRRDWDKAFQSAETGDDEIIGGDVANRFDEEEWEW